MTYRLLALAVVALAACGPANNDDGTNNTTTNNATTGGTATGGPFWEMAETDTTPAVTGTSVRFVNGQQTIELTDSDPPGWTLTFTAEDGFAENMFYASDNATGRVGGTIDGPDETCSVAPGDETGAQVNAQTATFEDGVPGGVGNITVVDCFGAPQPGMTFSAAFGVQPGR